MSVLSIARPDEPRIPGKCGRLAASIPVMLKWLSSYGTLPEAPPTVVRPQFAGLPWGMLANNRLGCCTFSGYVHLLQAIAAILGLPIPQPGDARVAAAYLSFTHGVDAGANEEQVLATALSAGLVGYRPLIGYAPGKGGVEELLQIVSTFGAAYLGGMMTASDQASFVAGEPWDLSSDTTIIGGHCFVAVEYDRSAEMAKVVTWGAEQLVTFRWLAARLDEQWAVIPRSVKDAGTIDGFRWDELDADLRALGGVVADEVGASAPNGPVDVPASTTSQVLLPANQGREGCVIFNNAASANLYITYGPVSSTSLFTTKVPPGQPFTMNTFGASDADGRFSYTGVISGVWDGSPSGADAAMCTDINTGP